MFARIYQPTKTAMQSGRAKSQHWVLEFEREKARSIDPLMGWTSSGDMRQQISLKFDTREAAIEYAVRNNIPHRVVEPRARKRRIKSYADNFAFDRKQPWTH